MLNYQRVIIINHPPFLARSKGIELREEHDFNQKTDPKARNQLISILFGAPGCPAENPYLEPIYSQLPHCLLSCPDPPMLPEGYRQEITFSGLVSTGIMLRRVSGRLHPSEIGWPPIWFLPISFWLVLPLVYPNAKHLVTCGRSRCHAC